MRKKSPHSVPTLDVPLSSCKLGIMRKTSIFLTPHSHHSSFHSSMSDYINPCFQETFVKPLWLILNLVSFIISLEVTGNCGGCSVLLAYICFRHFFLLELNERKSVPFRLYSRKNKCSMLDVAFACTRLALDCCREMDDAAIEENVITENVNFRTFRFYCLKADTFWVFLQVFLFFYFLYGTLHQHHYIISPSVCPERSCAFCLKYGRTFKTFVDSVSIVCSLVFPKF